MVITTTNYSDEKLMEIRVRRMIREDDDDEA